MEELPNLISVATLLCPRVRKLRVKEKLALNIKRKFCVDDKVISVD